MIFILYSLFCHIIFFMDIRKHDGISSNDEDMLLLLDKDVGFNIFISSILYLSLFVLSTIVCMIISMIIITYYPIDLFNWKLILVIQIIVTNLLRIIDTSIYIKNEE